jgi:hypothetical protein
MAAAKETFTLQFPASEIADLASRHDYATDHEAIQAGRQAHCQAVVGDGSCRLHVISRR